VGIYNADLGRQEAKGHYSYGEQGLLELLGAQRGIGAAYCPSLRGQELARFDVVIVPHVDLRGFDATPRGRDELPRYYHSLPAYAEAGGGVVLLSKSTGFNYPWPVRSSPFPEIACGYHQLSFISWKKGAWPLEPLGDHELARDLPACSLSKTMDFGDGSVVLREGKSGATFYSACGGFPIGVAGPVGKGRAVFFGLPLGIRKAQNEDGKWDWREGMASKEEQALAIAMVKWAGAPGTCGRERFADTVVAGAAVRLEGARESDLGLQRKIADLKKQSETPLEERESRKRPIPRFMRGFSVQYHPQDIASQRRCVEILKEAHATQFLHHYGWEKDWPPSHAESLFLHAWAQGIQGVTMRTISKMGHAAGSAVPIAGDIKPSGLRPPEPATFAKYPNYLMFSTDEPVQQPAHFLFRRREDGTRELIAEGVAEFKGFVKGRVEAEELAKLDFEKFLEECPHFAGPLPTGFLERHQVLWSLAGQFCAVKLNGLLQGVKECVKRADPNLHYTVTITPAWETWGPCGSFATIPDVPDLVWTDIYATGGYRDRFLLELLRSSGKKTVLWNGWHLSSAIDYRRSCLAGLTHAEGVMTFSLSPYYPVQAGWSAGRAKWVPGGYEVAKEIFGLAERNEKYLSPTQSTAKIAVLCSERTMWNHYYARWGGSEVYIPSLVATYRALVRGHFQVDAVFAEHLEKAGKLDPYSIVLAPNAETLTPGQGDALREWVRSGGTLVTTAETSRYDRFGRKRDQYGLGDVFHAEFIRQYADERRVPLEAFKTMQTRKLIFSKEVGPGTLMGERTAYDYKGAAHTKVYDSDVIKVKEGGHVVATWSDGGAAAVWGEYGKGRCLFFAGKWLPFCSEFGHFLVPTIEWVSQERRLGRAVIAESADASIELHLRAQPERRRLVLHITNLGGAMSLDRTSVDPKTCNYRLVTQPTSDVSVSLGVPEGWPTERVRILEAARGEQIEGNLKDGRVSFSIPDFVMYSLVVAEFGDGSP